MNYCILLITLVVSLTTRAQYSNLPITLSIPFDQDTIEEPEPNFVWQSNLAAIQSDPRLSQQIIVAQITGDQTPSEALSLNFPVFIRQDLVANSITYSPTDHELQKNTWYAWQVNYLFNGIVVQQSDAWKFILADELPPVTYYQAIREKNDGTVYTVKDDHLNLSIVSNSVLQLSCSVTDQKGVKTTMQLQEFLNGELTDADQSKPGTKTRYFSLDLGKLKKGMYTLSWFVGKKEYNIYFSKQ